MRQPRILDVVRAVRTVAESHPEVSAWWYAPPSRLRLAGALSADDTSRPQVELAIEVHVGRDADVLCIARELASTLSGVPVHVRRYAGDGEERQLFRLVSAGERLGARSPRADPAKALDRT